MSIVAIPEALQINTEQLPYVDNWGAPGLKFQLLMADVENAVFAVHIKFPPGIQLPPHHHTGAVHAYTLSGEWGYLEYPESWSKAGSYLYEPPGSAHTLKVADHNTEETSVFFVIHGAMLILDASGKVASVLDAASHIKDWAKALSEEGKPVPKIIVGGSAQHRQI
ncbi:2,4'-dihydroxyacetophenone dioxygenase family protein [Paraburkholderia caffeinilytica]|uniref:2,4'-dihydroxyacetophenone dioxygenase family protein n=1 Tax=Paraburkholderia caffeinilytica TaxID=1761016 RepID=UPI003D9FCD0D